MPTRDEFLCYIKKEDLALREYILAFQVDVEGDARDESGMTPFTIAIFNNSYPESIEVLVKHDADVNVRGEGGETPLDPATEKFERFLLTKLNLISVLC